MSQHLFLASGIFHPDSGGPATYLYSLAPALIQKGWQVRVQAFGEMNQGDQAYPYPVKRIPRRFYPIRQVDYWRQAKEALKWADLLYIHSSELALPKTKVPKILKVVGDGSWERAIRKGWIAPLTDIDAYQDGTDSKRATFDRKRRDRRLQGMDGIIVPSHYLKRMAMGWGIEEKRIKVIYNALPAQESQLDLTQEAARNLLGIAPDASVLFTAARLNPWKGVDTIIEALRSLKGIDLYIAGDGSELPHLRALAADMGKQVTFLGRIDRQQVALYMKACDYFILYSGYEGLAHSLLESLREGSPVIASDKGGNPEVVEDGVNGLLAPYQDVDALKVCIEKAFETGLRERLASHSQSSLAKFSFETMVKETDQTLLQYLKGTAG